MADTQSEEERPEGEVPRSKKADDITDLSGFKELFEHLLSSSESLSLNESVRLRIIELETVCRRGLSPHDDSYTCLVACDAFIVILVAGRHGAYTETRSPIVQIRTLAADGIAAESESIASLVNTIFIEWSSLRKKMEAVDPKRDGTICMPQSLALALRELSKMVSDRRQTMVRVTPLLTAVSPATGRWSRSVLAQSQAAFASFDSSCLQSGVAGTLRRRPTAVRFFSSSSSKWAVAGAMLGFVLGVFSIAITAAGSFNSGLILVPISIVAAFSGLCFVWYLSVKKEQRVTIREEAGRDVVDELMINLIAMSLVEMAAPVHSLSASAPCAQWSSNNCESLLLEKTLSRGDSTLAPSKEMGWPALPLPDTVGGSDIVTIKVDPSGTMVLPLAANLQCPILLDGYHVHQHIALFGVSLNGAALDASPSGSAGSGEFSSPADLPRLDDADDRRFTVSMWNDAISRITGFSSSAVLFNPFADFIADERSYSSLKRLVLMMEDCASRGEVFPTVSPFQIFVLTSACERVMLTVTAAPVTEQIVTDCESPLGEGHAAQRLLGVLFLGSLAANDDLHQWKSTYYATLLRYFHAKARPVHTIDDGQLGVCLSSEMTAEDFKAGTLSQLDGVVDGSVAFTPLQVALMKMATDHFSANTEAEGAPFIFTKGPRDRTGLIFSRQDISASLRMLLSDRQIVLKPSQIRARSSLPFRMEIDLDAVAEMLTALLKDGASVGSITLAPFGKGYRGDGTIAMGVRMEGVSADVMSFVSHRLVPPEDGVTPPDPLWECMAGGGGFLFSSDRGVFMSTESEGAKDENTLVLVIPCRSRVEHTSLDEPVDARAGAVKASIEGVLRSIDTSDPRLPPLSILVSNSNRITRANLMRLLSDDHHAVFPVKGDFLPKGAHFMRTCGRVFDVVVADSVGSDMMAEMHALCREFSSTSFILKKRGRKEQAPPVSVVEPTADSESLVSILPDLPAKALVNPPNLHFVDASHTPMSQRQLVRFIEDVAIAASASQKKAMDIKEILRGHVNSPWSKGQRLGKGSFGDVFEAHMTLTGGVAAVKTIRVRHTPGEEADPLAAIVAEIGILVRLQHPNIVQYFYCEQETDGAGLQLHIFMELCKGGSIKDKIAAAEAKQQKKRPAPVIAEGLDAFGGPFTLTEVASNLLQIVDALQYLHSQEIVHRDIKPGNLLLSAGKVKMADFGTAKIVGKGQSLQDTAGTFAYMAPEVYSGDSYSYPCDIWSVGCVLLDMLGTPLRKSVTDDMAGATIFSGYFGDAPSDSVIRERLQKHILHADLRGFLLRCLCVSPSDRATAKELRQHPFLTRHTQKQDSIVRNSSLLRSTTEWKKMVKQAVGTKQSLDALSIESDDSDWEDASTVLNLSSEKHSSSATGSLSPKPGVTPFSLAALQEPSAAQPIHSESPVFVNQTPCNVWHSAGRENRPSFASASETPAKSVTARPNGGWNPLWGMMPLESPSRQKGGGRVTASVPSPQRRDSAKGAGDAAGQSDGAEEYLRSFLKQ